MIQFKLKLTNDTLKVLRHLKIERLTCKMTNEDTDFTQFYWDNERNAYLTVNTGFDIFLANYLNLEEVNYE